MPKFDQEIGIWTKNGAGFASLTSISRCPAAEWAAARVKWFACAGKSEPLVRAATADLGKPVLKGVRL